MHFNTLMYTWQQIVEYKVIITLFFPAACICPWDCCITDPVCVAGNLACDALKAPLLLALEAAKFFVDKSRGVLDAAIAILSGAQGVVNAAEESLNLAIAFLEGVKRTYRVGVNALDAITKFTLTEIVNIREMYFKVELSVANGGVFQCRVKGVLLGNNINLELTLNIRNPLELAKSLAEKAISGISKFFG